MKVLLVEDDTADAWLTMRAWRSLRSDDALVHVRDSVSAREWMATQMPDLVLLDLSLPCRGALELLQALVARGVQVVVVTSSADPRDVRRVQELGAVRYIHKPWAYEQLRQELGCVVASLVV